MNSESPLTFSFSNEFNDLKLLVNNGHSNNDSIMNQSKKCCKSMKTFRDYKKYKDFRIFNKNILMISEEYYIDDLIKNLNECSRHELILEKMNITLLRMSEHKSELNETLSFFSEYVKDFFTIISLMNILTSHIGIQFDIYQKLVEISSKIINNENSVVKLKGFLCDSIMFLKKETQFQIMIRDKFVENIKNQLIKQSSRMRKETIKDEINKILEMSSFVKNT